MKRIIAFFSLVISIISCVPELELSQSSGNDVLTVFSSPDQLEEVRTRSAKYDNEIKIETKTMLIYDKNGILAKIDFKTGKNATFIIDRKKDFPDYKQKQDALNGCVIYIVANLPKGELNESNCVAIDDLLNHKVHTTPLLKPEDIAQEDFPGFPMIGKAENVDLREGGNVGANSTHIPLKSLYTKMLVYLMVKPEQNVPGEIPYFKLNKWTVHNIPTYTELREPAEGQETIFVREKNSNYLVHEETKVSGNNPAMGDNGLYFFFYVLEHRVNPQNKIEDIMGKIEGIKEDEKQRYKPKLCTDLQHPMYIVLEGKYYDHQGHSHEVKYSLYLGQDKYDANGKYTPNFYVNRNTFYNNVVTIKGLTNHKGTGENVSIDHRVEVKNQDVTISVERETMLDCHWEIRPLDIDFKTDKVESVEITILNAQQQAAAVTDQSCNWVRFEKINSAPDNDPDHCTNGKRKYFTTDLVTTTLNSLDNIHTVIDSLDQVNNNNRIWIYFDENPNKPSTDGMREAVLEFKYNFKDGRPAETMTYKFRQHNIYPVNVEVTDNTGKTQIIHYGIEYYEEYLYNFDPKDKYSIRTDGMQWGMKDFLYSEHDAIEKTSGFLDQLKFLSDTIKVHGGKYDYKNNYDGVNYTNKLIKFGDHKHKDGFLVLDLDTTPNSAAEYCYNKNKRDAQGHIKHIKNPETNTMEDGINQGDWYLPAIGEIQAITTKAYTKFLVFQEQYYWSSQTSYQRGIWTNGIIYKDWWGKENYKETSKGDFFIEDLTKARATMTKMVNGKAQYIPSEVKGYHQYLKFWLSLSKLMKYEDKKDDFTDAGIQNNVVNSDPGNIPRDKILRVRAVKRLP